MPMNESTENSSILHTTDIPEDVSDWDSEQGVVEAIATMTAVTEAAEIVLEETRGASKEGVRDCHHHAADVANAALAQFVAEKTQVMGRPPIRSGHNGYTQNVRTRPARLGSARKCWLTVWVKCYAVFAR